MRLIATLMLVLAFALVRPLAGQAEALGPCMEAPAAAMPCHEMAMGDAVEGMRHQAPASPAEGKTGKAVHGGCASACCASPALMPAVADQPAPLRQPALLTAAVDAAAAPVPHAPDLRPPIA